jgi:hypothetical protein
MPFERDDPARCSHRFRQHRFEECSPLASLRISALAASPRLHASQALARRLSHRNSLRKSTSCQVLPGVGQSARLLGMSVTAMVSRPSQGCRS